MLMLMLMAMSQHGGKELSSYWPAQVGTPFKTLTFPIFARF
jgi:hypothetical protein